MLTRGTFTFLILIASQLTLTTGTAVAQTTAVKTASAPSACAMIDTLMQDNDDFSNVLVGVDALLVSKQHRRMWAFMNGNSIKSYHVSIGQNPLGAKEIEGDMKTPEGTYRITSKNPQSKYYKALEISYPEKKDLARARELGASPGGDVMLHGLPVDTPEKRFAIYKNSTTRAWTRGCVAVENEEIDELYPKVSVGTPIVICP